VSPIFQTKIPPARVYHNSFDGIEASSGVKAGSKGGLKGIPCLGTGLSSRIQFEMGRVLFFV